MVRWLFGAAAVGVFLVLAAFVLIRFEPPFGGAERLWAQPWDKVKGHSESLCRTITKSDQDSFVVCMSIEHKSHKLLQTSFGLPAAEAAQLKTRCSEFQYFTPQLRCVEKSLAESREN